MQPSIFSENVGFREGYICQKEERHYGKLTYQWKLDHLKMYFLHQMGDFPASHGSLQEVPGTSKNKTLNMSNLMQPVIGCQECKSQSYKSRDVSGSL